MQTNDVRAHGWRKRPARKRLFVPLAAMPALLVGLIGTTTGAGAAALPRPVAVNEVQGATSVTEDVLTALSCPAGNECVAVGYSGTPNTQGALIELWNGNTWAAVPVPLPKNKFSSSLDGISCPSTSSCTAVGDYFNTKTNFIEPLILTGSGSKWALVPNPGLAQGSGAVLSSVSCASTTDCLAIGENLVASGLGRAERWNGKRWAVVAPLTPPNATEVGLDSVSCAAADACMAVGFYELGGDQLTLSESFNGSKWAIEQTPGGPTAALRSVSCVAAGSCMAVGTTSTTDNAEVAFAVTWNGRTWTATKAKGPAGRVAPELDGVSCESAKSCIAVGLSSENTIVNPTEAALAETWNGSAWTLVDPPVPASARGSQVLAAVAATGASGAIAIGNDSNVISGSQLTLAEEWSGAHWTTLVTSNP